MLVLLSVVDSKQSLSSIVSALASHCHIEQPVAVEVRSASVTRFKPSINRRSDCRSVEMPDEVAARIVRPLLGVAGVIGGTGATVKDVIRECTERTLVGPAEIRMSVSVTPVTLRCCRRRRPYDWSSITDRAETAGGIVG